MAEHMSAEIWIGGSVPKRLVSKLCAAICQEDVSLEWGGSGFRPESAADLLGVLLNESGVPLLQLYDDQARWGQFEELEEFLQKHGISYRRRSDSKWEYDAEIVEFRPGLKTVSYPTNSTGQPFVLLASLIAVDEALSKARLRLRQGLVTNPAAALRQVQGLLREQLPPRVPDLKPFEIPGIKFKLEAIRG